MLSRHALLLVVATGAAACLDVAGIVPALEIPGPADLTAVVTSNTHEEFFGPSGYWISQYDVWIALPPSDTANAGVLVNAYRPVFVSGHGVLRRVTPAEISPGDSIEVWRERGVAYGSTSAPVGAPAYFAKQVLIHRSIP